MNRKKSFAVLLQHLFTKMIGIVVQAVALATLPAADPTCRTGVGYYNYCCAKSCGLCGGSHCRSRTGGYAGCCMNGIRASLITCSTQGPSTEAGGCMLDSTSCVDTLAVVAPQAHHTCQYYHNHAKCAEPWIRTTCAKTCGICAATGGQGAWFVGISNIRVGGRLQPAYDPQNPSASYATFYAKNSNKEVARGVQMYVDQPASKFGTLPRELYRLGPKILQAKLLGDAHHQVI